MGSLYPIPSFLIQPLVETALWHGINDTEKSNVSLHFEAYENNNTLEITVTYDGRGLPKKVEERTQIVWPTNSKGKTSAISEESQFAIENREGAKGCVSKLTIPLFHGIA